MDLVKFWEEDVAKGHKHYANELSSVKKRRLRDRFKKHCLDLVDWDSVNFAVDWGCGGGLLAKMIPESVKLLLVDISQEAVYRARDYVKRDVEIEQQTDPATFRYNYPQADLLWCYSVIHNFPSISYWEHVVELWDEIAPKQIAIQTKIGDETREATDYAENYYDGLVLTKKDLVEPFKNYEVSHFKIEKVPSKWNLGFAILDRKECES